jgi:capsule polysaccharide export protein KpsE/RkpR
MVVDFVFSCIDSAIMSINIDRARRKRLYIESSLERNEQSLDSLQTLFKEFQLANKAYSIPQQMELTLKAYADIKAASAMEELKMDFLRKNYKRSTPEINEIRKRLAVYRQKMAQLEKETNPNVLPSLELSAELIPHYINLKRELEVSNKIILLLSSELEQAKIEESRHVSPLIIIDPSFVPQYKARPKRALVILAIVGIEMFVVFTILIYSYYYHFFLKKNPDAQRFFSIFAKRKNAES